MRRRRQLHPEEEALWQAVAKTARPMHQARAMFDAPAAGETAMPVDALPLKPAQGLTSPATMPRVLPSFRLGEKARGAPPAAVKAPEALRMDAKTHQRMTKGKLLPEARIDLHGMTLSEAYPELTGFILGAQEAGLRLVLVITGKGKMMHEPVPRPTGALRHQVPYWLRLPPLAQAVQQTSEAHLKHGGSGALYVYLRRR